MFRGGGGGGALIDNRRCVCAAAGSCRRRPGARSGGPDEDATPVGVSTGGPASAGGARRCGSRGRGATGQRVRLSRGRVRVRAPPSPLEQGRGAGRPRRPHTRRSKVPCRSDSRRAVAQPVAHVVRDHGAAGSNPACSTRLDSSAGRAAARRAARPRFDSWSRHAAPVAQPDRVPGYEPGGWGFDSLQARDRCPLAQWGERASDIREVAGSTPAGTMGAPVAQPEQSASLRSSRSLVRVQPGALVGDSAGRSFHTGSERRALASRFESRQAHAHTLGRCISERGGGP